MIFVWMGQISWGDGYDPVRLLCQREHFRWSFRNDSLEKEFVWPFQARMWTAIAETLNLYTRNHSLQHQANPKEKDRRPIQESGLPCIKTENVQTGVHNLKIASRLRFQMIRLRFGNFLALHFSNSHWNKQFTIHTDGDNGCVWSLNTEAYQIQKQRFFQPNCEHLCHFPAVYGGCYFGMNG